MVNQERRLDAKSRAKTVASLCFFALVSDNNRNKLELRRSDPNLQVRSQSQASGSIFAVDFRNHGPGTSAELLSSR